MIGGIAPDVLAVQEVGDPQALEDLRGRLDGDWQAEASEFPDGRGIRWAFSRGSSSPRSSRSGEFPDQLAPVQGDDEGATVPQMGRGALRVRVSTQGRDVDLVNCHLKSKLLTFPGGRFPPRDEGERARFGAYALYRRTAEAVTVRAHADELLDGEARPRRGGARRPKRRAPCRHHADPAGTAGF